MDTDEQAIRATQAAWLDATAKGDLSRLLPLMAEDVVFLQPGRQPFGRDEFAALFSAGLQQVRISCAGELEEVVVVGDAAYARARLSASVTPLAGGEARHLAGYTLSVFRKLPDGRWVLARDANLLTPVAASANIWRCPREKFPISLERAATVRERVTGLRHRSLTVAAR